MSNVLFVLSSLRIDQIRQKIDIFASSCMFTTYIYIYIYLKDEPYRWKVNPFNPFAP